MNIEHFGPVTVSIHLEIEEGEHEWRGSQPARFLRTRCPARMSHRASLCHWTISPAGKIFGSNRAACGVLLPLKECIGNHLFLLLWEEVVPHQKNRRPVARDWLQNGPQYRRADEARGPPYAGPDHGPLRFQVRDLKGRGSGRIEVRELRGSVPPHLGRKRRGGEVR